MAGKLQEKIKYAILRVKKSDSKMMYIKEEIK